MKARNVISREFKQVIHIVVTDMDKYEESRRTGKAYLPFTLEAEIDNKLSYSESMRGACAAFFRHITGAIEPEFLDNDE